MAPSLWAVNIPIHMLLNQLMTRSHVLNLEKGSFRTLRPETRALNFKSKKGQKGSTALRQISSSEKAPTSSQTLNTSTSYWLHLQSTCPTAQYIMQLVDYR